MAHELKAGDTEPLVAVLKDARGPVDLGVSPAQAAVTFRMSSKVTGTGGPPVSGPCVVMQTDGGSGRVIDKGMVSFQWPSGATDIPGVYRAVWRVQFLDGSVRSFPSVGYEDVLIDPLP